MYYLINNIIYSIIILKEQEIQIKLLNNLREKDTIHHLKSLSELDSQLRKKSSDADKVSHFADQIRVKQERIIELENQVSRFERQSNQERQTFEKQAHENWVNSRKVEKELKEAKFEISSLTEKNLDLETSIKNLNESRQALNKSMVNMNYMMSPQSKILDKSKTEPDSEIEENNSSDNLQVDTSTNQHHDFRAPLSNSTMMLPNQAMIPPFSFMRPTYRYPFMVPQIMPPSQYNIQATSKEQRTNSSSPDPNPAQSEPLRVQAPPYSSSFHPNPMMYQMNSMMMQKQYQQYFQGQSSPNASVAQLTNNPVE